MFLRCLLPAVGQFEGEWEDVIRPAIGNGAEQGTLRAPEHTGINTANYSIADYLGQPYEG
jgi:hypothetical protein